MDGEQRRDGNLISKPCILLIAIGGLERFAFKGVSSNLVMYLTEVVGMSNSTAAKTVNGWVGVTWLLPLAVAPLTDSYCDQYTTILSSSFLYAAGLLALTWTATPGSSEKAIPTSSLLWPLLLVSLGQAGYSPSLQAFSAGQQERPGSDESTHQTNRKSLFFQWWYFGVCTGSLLGVGVMSYIQDTFGWQLGFAIPAIAMVFSILLFSCASRHYYYYYRNKRSKNEEHEPLRRVIRAVGVNVSKIMGRDRIRLGKSELVELELQVRPICDQTPQSYDPDNPSGMEKTKILIRLMPVWATLLMFAVIFQLPPTFFTKQGTAMRRNIGNGFKIPPAALQSAITLSVILLMPLYDKLLVPAVKAIANSGISVQRRMGIGMFLSVIATAIAAIVETRRRVMRETMSIFWLLPQYILLGIADIFTVVGMQEFFYSRVPPRMRATGIALYSSVFGVGSFLGAGLISLIELFTGSSGRETGWFADDMKDARLDKGWRLILETAARALITDAMNLTTGPTSNGVVIFVSHRDHLLKQQTGEIC